ncbi:MAG: metalloregulator ArsR/SmtB family transcription factor [Actinobacteria bacterium]|nr:metalloregulator ArsR/SmtB family transcription factor [Actinomycetota bacterium]
MPSTPAVGPHRFLELVGDPQRWRLLRALATSDRRVGELVDLTGKPQSLVSYHLGQLRSAGLVSSRRSAADGRDTYYRANLGRCGDLLRDVGTALHPVVCFGPGRPPERPGRLTPKPRVLFLCTGNSSRSQMAEALLGHRSGGTISARSAGSHPKALHPNAVRVMAERGIDISGRASKHLSRFSRSRFDHVITLCDKVKEVCPEFPGHPTAAHWSMPDPAATAGDDATIYPAFVQAADEIDERIAPLMAQITASKGAHR